MAGLESVSGQVSVLLNIQQSTSGASRGWRLRGQDSRVLGLRLKLFPVTTRDHTHLLVRLETSVKPDQHDISSILLTQDLFIMMKYLM